MKRYRVLIEMEAESLELAASRVNGSLNHNKPGDRPLPLVEVKAIEEIQVG